MNIKLNYDDITIVPEAVTTIESRTECNCFDEQGFLPIWASCMDTVCGTNSYLEYLYNHIRCILPRTISLEKRMEYCGMGFWVAFSLSEAKVWIPQLFGNPNIIRVCIDMANGHMEDLLDTIKTLRNKFGDRIELMSGNIANPESYKLYEEAGCDYVRVGIGGGSACLVGDTPIKMADGTTEIIENINVGDYVETMNGKHRVMNIFDNGIKNTMIVNDVECTPDHKFFCVRKDLVDNIDDVSDDFIKEHGEYIEAKNLSTDRYYLVEA